MDPASGIWRPKNAARKGHELGKLGRAGAKVLGPREEWWLLEAQSTLERFLASRQSCEKANVILNSSGF